MIGFLRRLIKGARQEVFLILGNLRVHHSKPVKEWLAKHADAIGVFYLPNYSPELNPDEMVNAGITQAVTGQRLHEPSYNRSKQLPATCAASRNNPLALVATFNMSTFTMLPDASSWKPAQ